MLLKSLLIATLAITQIDEYPRRTDLPPPVEKPDGSVCMSPELSTEVARELLYCDSLPEKCNRQLRDTRAACKDAVECPQTSGLLAPAALVVGALAAGLLLQSPELAAAGLGGGVVLLFVW